MICSYPWMGALTQRFGIRKVSAGGACLAFAATLPFLYLASHGLVVAVLACALFLRGVGLSAVGIPSISAAYASVKKQDLPMATTSLNIVQRLGGPTMTTLCATFLGWRLRLATFTCLPLERICLGLCSALLATCPSVCCFPQTSTVDRHDDRNISRRRSVYDFGNDRVMV